MFVMPSITWVGYLVTWIPIMNVLVCLVCAAAFVRVRALAATDSKSVLCVEQQPSQYKCTVGDFSSSSWTARAALDSASINTTGWARLVVEGQAGVSAGITAYSQGFIEGFLSRELMDLSW
jgi:hypothetical protein